MLDSLRFRLIPLALSVPLMLLPYIHNAWAKHQVALAANVALVKISQPKAPVQPAIIQGHPTRIIIPAASIDLPIVNGTYDASAKKWSVSDTNANFATNTTLPNNQRGATFIYGHNASVVLGNARYIQLGDVAYVNTDNNHVFEYSLTDSRDLKPDETSIFTDMATSSPGLRLMTCNGWQFEYRHYMSFKLVNAS